MRGPFRKVVAFITAKAFARGPAPRAQTRARRTTPLAGRRAKAGLCPVLLAPVIRGARAHAAARI